MPAPPPIFRGGPRPQPPCRRHGPPRTGRLPVVSRSGLTQLRALVEQHAIDCDWDENGWMLACVGEKGLHELDEIEPVYRELDYRMDVLDRDAMEHVTGTRLYRKALRFPGYPLVHAAALVRGLGDSLPDGITLYENTPITAIDSGSLHTLTSPAGTVTTEKVFLATKQRSAAQVHHRRAFRARFPQLGDIPFEHTWAGLMGVSNSAQPAIQELQPGIYTAAGYTATGIALGTASGIAAVDLAFNHTSRELQAAESLKGPSWVPPEPFRTLGGTAVAELMNRQAADYI